MTHEPSQVLTFGTVLTLRNETEFSMNDILSDETLKLNYHIEKFDIVTTKFVSSTSNVSFEVFDIVTHFTSIVDSTLRLSLLTEIDDIISSKIRSNPHATQTRYQSVLLTIRDIPDFVEYQKMAITL